MTIVKAEDIIGLDYAIANHDDVELAKANIHEEEHVLDTHTDTHMTGDNLDELVSEDFTELHDHENWTINEEPGFNTP